MSGAKEPCPGLGDPTLKTIGFPNMMFEHLPMSPNEARHGSHHCMQDMRLQASNDLHGNTGMLFVMMSESVFIAARNTILDVCKALPSRCSLKDFCFRSRL